MSVTNLIEKLETAGSQPATKKPKKRHAPRKKKAHKKKARKRAKHKAKKKARKSRGKKKSHRKGGKKKSKRRREPSHPRTEREARGNPGVRDEALWARAKRVVKPHWQSYDQPWAVVQKVYKNLGGT